VPRLNVEIYQSLLDALTARCNETGESLRHFVSRALSDALGLDHSTLFQVSTTGALVEGVYKGAVTVGELKKHGDFGLGTFEGLDGEMVVVDGRFYQVHSDGRITVPPDAAPVPFAVVTTFHPPRRVPIAGFTSFEELTRQLDAHRRSNNLFFAVRLDSRFAEIHTRVACKAEAGVPLDQATAHQAEFRMKEVTGSIVGFWSPPYARSINVAGWHLHFLTDDRKGGGHLLGCAGQGLEAKLQDLDDLRLAIPETAQFLHADLTRDPSAALDKAERAH
jgi:acetolactate decarboxylase